MARRKRDTSDAQQTIPGDPETNSVDLEWSRIGDMGGDPAESLVRTVKKIFDQDAMRYENYRRLNEAYGADMTARGGSTTAEEKAFDESLSMNELANTIETLHSQLFKNRIIVSVATIGGNYGQMSRAKQKGRWIQGVFDDNRLHEELTIRAGFHGLTNGTGLFRVGHEVIDEEAKLARVTISVTDTMDFAVDPLDAEDGRPWCEYVRGRADRASLLEAFCCEEDDTLFGTVEERKEAIRNAKKLRDSIDHTSAGILDNDLVVIYEGWRRPTASGEKGRYVLATDGGTLIDREYTLQDTAHVPIRLFPGPTGYYGQSAVARLVPGQRTYDKMNERGDRAHDIMGVPRIIVRTGVGIKKSHIDDEIGSILEMDDPGGITEWNPTPIHPDFYRERDSLPQKMRGIVGVNQMSATGQLPGQLREASGVALEGWQDSESARHAMSHRGYETAIVRLAYRVIEEAAWLQEHGYDVQVLSLRGNVLEKIDFSDVAMDRGNFKLRALPISQLSQSFTGRVNQLRALRQDGAISQAQYIELAQVPDTEAAGDFFTAAEDMVMSTLGHIYETGDTVEILSFDNKAMIIEKGVQFIHYLRLQKNRSKEHRRNLAAVVGYVQDAYAQLQAEEAAKAPPPPPPMPPGLPMGPDPMMGPPMGPPGPPMDPGMGPPGMGPGPMGPPPMA